MQALLLRPGAGAAAALLRGWLAAACPGAGQALIRPSSTSISTSPSGSSSSGGGSSTASATAASPAAPPRSAAAPPPWRTPPPVAATHPTSPGPASRAPSPPAPSPLPLLHPTPLCPHHPQHHPSTSRSVSTQPEHAIYSGPSPPSPRRVTLRTLRTLYKQNTPITMATAYDYPSAVHVDQANIDILLVGDSVAMVMHGHDTTLPITLDEMLMHCRAVARGSRRAFLVGDLPFGSYETGVRDAVVTATRVLKEGGMDAVKLEGGSPARVEAAHAIVEAGVAVMGHVGLTPQSISVIGGFRPQAQVADEALAVLDQAQALQRAGCFALVLECVPGPIAAAITKSVGIPTIGIGAGPATSGQVLVYHDLLGMMSHPHHAKVTPKFCKQFAHVGQDIQAALQQYRSEVTSRQFPSAQHTPYRIPQHEAELLAATLRQRGAVEAAEAVEQAAGWERGEGGAPPA